MVDMNKDFLGCKNLMKINEILQTIKLPPDCSIKSYEKIKTDGKNIVLKCNGNIYKKNKVFYLKINYENNKFIKNEIAVLNKLKEYYVKAPVLLFYENNYLAIEKISGDEILYLIDPRNLKYNKNMLIENLKKYGKALAEVHNLAFNHKKQGRTKLYDFLGDEELYSKEFEKIVKWLEKNRPKKNDIVFTHGDFNTANVFFNNNVISGIIDWEFSGLGWKEYDLAWILRARLTFLNTQEEYNAILNGYKKNNEYNPDILKWCEVMNYLHFAFWNKNDNIKYTLFAKSIIEKKLK